MNLSGCRSYWAVLMGTRGRRALLLPPSPGQHLQEGATALSLLAGCRGWAPAARATPGDHRAAPLRAELWRALGLGGIRAGTAQGHTAVSPLPSVQGSRSRPSTQEPSRCPRAPACWRRGHTTGPRPPSACSSSSPPGAACWPPRAAHGRSRCPAPADLSPLPAGAASCTSARWWWTACSGRRPAPCGSRASALTTRDTRPHCSPEARPSAQARFAPALPGTEHAGPREPGPRTLPRTAHAHSCPGPTPRGRRHGQDGAEDQGGEHRPRRQPQPHPEEGDHVYCVHASRRGATDHPG